MTTESRSPREIEREIERNRAQLTSNLENLQDRFSVDSVMRQIGDQLREHGGEIGHAVSRTVKENPAAVALTGIGLAWLIFGGGQKPRGSRPSVRPVRDYGRDLDYDGHSDDGGYSTGAASRSRWEDRPASGDYGSSYAASRSVPRPDPRMKGGTVGVPSWARTDDLDDNGGGIADRAASAAASARDSITGAASAAGDKAAEAGSAVSGAASDAGTAAKSKASAAGSAVKDKAAAAGEAVRGTASAAASAASGAMHSAQERAARMRARLAEGTENLSEEARARVIAAREAAVDARRRAAAAVARQSEQAADLYDRQPLVAGALALALGAAIGGALPRTRTEDDLMGAHSDALMERAEEIFREEREKAAAVLEAAKSEAEAIAKEKREEIDRKTPSAEAAAKTVAEEAKAAGKRVADAAAEKAKEKNLGKPSS
ncbi:DUF3618 domain-containing protein [Roseobacteraceae bacterium NS-SX3]